MPVPTSQAESAKCEDQTRNRQALSWGFQSVYATLLCMWQNRHEGSIRSKELGILLESSFVLLRRRVIQTISMEPGIGKGREHYIHLTVPTMALPLPVAPL